MEDLAEPSKHCSQERHFDSGEHQLPTEGNAREGAIPSYS